MFQPLKISSISLRWFSFTIAFAVLIIDQLSKRIAVSTLSGEPPVDVIASLRWNLHFNAGSAFSRGQGLGRWIALLVVIVVVFLVRSRIATMSRSHAAATGLILGGAIGNLVDRVLRANDGVLTGKVVDFIDLQFWPIFNLADAAIVVGVISIVALETFGSKVQK